jgi:hypothetical protein
MRDWEPRVGETGSREGRSVWASGGWGVSRLLLREGSSLADTARESDIPAARLLLA